MAIRNRIGRREFIATSAGALAAGLGSACGCVPMREIEEAAAKVGTIPRRALDRSGRKVSVLIGAADWASEAVEAGILCGVNYWHRSHAWDPRQFRRRSGRTAKLITVRSASTACVAITKPESSKRKPTTSS